MFDNVHATVPRNMSFKEYKKMKMRMLCDFCIELTPEEKERINQCKTEIQLDQFCLGVLNSRWG